MKETVFIVRSRTIPGLIVITAKAHNRYLLKKVYPWHAVHVSEENIGNHLPTICSIPYNELLVQIAIGSLPNILDDSEWNHVGGLNINLTPQDGYWRWDEKEYIPLHKLINLWWGPWHNDLGKR